MLCYVTHSEPGLLVTWLDILCDRSREVRLFTQPSRHWESTKPPFMDRVHGLLFLLPLNLVVIKDYECALCLWCNLNSCLLLKSLSLYWKFTDKKSPAFRNLNFSEEPPQMDPKIDNDFACYWFNPCVTSSGSANISTREPVYPWFIWAFVHYASILLSTLMRQTGTAQREGMGTL